MIHIDPTKFPPPDISQVLEKNKRRYEVFNRLILMMNRIGLDIVDNDFITKDERNRVRHRMVSKFSYDLNEIESHFK